MELLVINLCIYSQPIDNKRDQFRRYVENHGVVEMLTKVLIKLMTIPEKPDNPIDFIREHVGASLKEKEQIEILQQEVDSYREQVESLTKQLEEAKQAGFNTTSKIEVECKVEAQPKEEEAKKEETVVATATEDKVEVKAEATESKTVVAEVSSANEVVADKFESVTEVAVAPPAEAEVAKPAEVAVVEPTKSVENVVVETKVEAKPVEAVPTDEVAKPTDSEQKIAEVLAATAN